MKFLKELLDDGNTINEKAVVGFIAFMMLVIALGVDLVTGYFGNPLVINEFILEMHGRFIWRWFIIHFNCLRIRV
jgi:hypothetical protein